MTVNQKVVEKLKEMIVMETLNIVLQVERVNVYGGFTWSIEGTLGEVVLYFVRNLMFDEDTINIKMFVSKVHYSTLKILHKNAFSCLM